jgi:hypothetical protein
MANPFDPRLFSGMFGAPPRASSLLGLYATKRKAFFSFHYDDIMRVNVVRNAWKITHPDSDQARGFYDGSLWESRKLNGDESVKTLIREGVEHTSAVCVLIGSETWRRRWVKYEIARAHPYTDHTLEIKLPNWLADPPHHNWVMPLSHNATVNDYMADNGHQNIGGWIDRAAQAAGY